MSNVIKIERNNGKRVGLKFKDEVEDFSNNSISKQVQLDALFHQHFEKGYKDGYDAAGQELVKEYDSQLEAEKLNFENFMKHVDNMMLNYDKAFENTIIDLAFKISEKIIRREIVRETNISAVLKEAVRKVIGTNNILIKLNPGDYEKINKDNSQNKFLDESLAKINFQTDERIECGGCVIETDIGNVDARINTQLAELKKYFE